LPFFYYYYYVVFVVVLGVHCDLYQSSYNIPSFSFIPFSPHSWNSFCRSHFSVFIYEHIIFLLHSLSLHPFLVSALLPLVSTPRQELFSPFCFLFLKKVIFVCLRYPYREFHYGISIIYVLYPELIHLLHFSSFYLNPFLMVISTGLKNLYSFLHRKYISHIHFLNFLLSPCPIGDLSLVFFIILLVFELGLDCTYGTCLSILELRMHVLTLLGSERSGVENTSYYVCIFNKHKHRGLW
jgi:hypothetical protein